MVPNFSRTTVKRMKLYEGHYTCEVIKSESEIGLPFTYIH